MKTLIIGSRRSQLAQIQSHLIRRQLLDAWPDLQIKIELIDTQGDLNRKDPLPAIGGKGLFTIELEEALRRRKIDLAVHSLKDLPIEDSAGLTVVAISQRAPTADVFVSRVASRIEDLPQGAVVGTSSLRRAAQVLALRPDLSIKDIRGNVDTRLRKLDDPVLGYDAILLAQAGLRRLGYQLDYAHPIAESTFLPAPGQGALAVQGRADDPDTTAYLQILDDADTRAAVTAERAFLGGLGGGCSLPVGALATVNDGQLFLKAMVADPGGKRVITVAGESTRDRAEELGQQLAEQCLDQGAEALLHI
ncbi:MAG: hydroxymethylbilane synthase [Anaerolineae bacterium]|nr:hydroxymethylbilane synthase [Anaerolineae bacterium]